MIWFTGKLSSTFHQIPNCENKLFNKTTITHSQDTQKSDTLDLIKTHYYWPMIKWDIARYIKGCDKCQRVKTDTLGKKTPLNLNTIPNAPWEIISVDLIGPLPESKGKNDIMVIVNQFSKMIQLFPVSTEITSQGMAKIFRDEIFKLHGIPKKVISDQGPQFVLSFMKELYSQL